MNSKRIKANTAAQHDIPACKRKAGTLKGKKPLYLYDDNNTVIWVDRDKTAKECREIKEKCTKHMIIL